MAATTKVFPAPHHAPLVDASADLPVASPIWSDWFQKVFARIGELGAKFPVQTADIGDAQVTLTKLGQSLAGSGLTGPAGSTLSVNVDGSTLEINTNALRVKDGGIPFAKLLSTDWTSSQAASGYQKLPSGLYMQWGVTTSIASGLNSTITFPTAFPAACFQVLVSITGNGAAPATDTGQAGVSSLTATNFVLNNRTSAAHTFAWFAVGN